MKKNEYSGEEDNRGRECSQQNESTGDYVIEFDELFMSRNHWDGRVWRGRGGENGGEIMEEKGECQKSLESKIKSGGVKQ